MGGLEWGGCVMVQVKEFGVRLVGRGVSSTSQTMLNFPAVNYGRRPHTHL